MLIGRFVDRQLQVIDRVREHVCLAAGLDDENRISDEACERAVRCLERMAERLRNVPGEGVRAVGTNTLRRAVNGPELREACERALGHDIEIVSGQEEARLIYLGVAHAGFREEARLVIDIGGGSTEVIVGSGFDVTVAHSLFMGCVSWSRRFFPEGELRKEAFRKAEIAARLELTGIAKALRELGWSAAVGTAGTVNAVSEILRAGGWGDGEITPEGLKLLRRRLIEAGSVARLDLDGLKRDRAAVLPGGLAILRALFKALRIERLDVSSGAMREGVLYDLIGRMRHEDVRDRTIAGMIERYQIDRAQAGRVERTALRLLTSAPLAEDGFDAETARRLLVWAARLHEAGIALSFTGYHRHGAYLVEHGEMPGFSRDEQRTLAVLIRTHRRRLQRALFAAIPQPERAAVERLAVIFRLAVLLNRGRLSQMTPTLAVDDQRSRLRLEFPAGWTEANPLSLADLEQEQSYLRALDVRLEVRERSSIGE